VLFSFGIMSLAKEFQLPTNTVGLFVRFPQIILSPPLLFLVRKKENTTVTLWNVWKLDIINCFAVPAGCPGKEAGPIRYKETKKNKKKSSRLQKITFALVADVAVILGNDIAGRVLHERLVNNLFIVVGSLLLPQGAQAGRSKRTGVTRQLNP
jgi:hypothetical protein